MANEWGVEVEDNNEYFEDWEWSVDEDIFGEAVAKISARAAKLVIEELIKGCTLDLHRDIHTNAIKISAVFFPSADLQLTKGFEAAIAEFIEDIQTGNNDINDATALLHAMEAACDKLRRVL